jgi:hypothetical protein
MLAFPYDKISALVAPAFGTALAEASAWPLFLEIVEFCLATWTPDECREVFGLPALVEFLHIPIQLLCEREPDLIIQFLRLIPDRFPEFRYVFAGLTELPSWVANVFIFAWVDLLTGDLLQQAFNYLWVVLQYGEPDYSLYRRFAEVPDVTEFLRAQDITDGSLERIVRRNLTRAVLPDFEFFVDFIAAIVEAQPHTASVIVDMLMRIMNSYLSSGMLQVFQFVISVLTAAPAQIEKWIAQIVSVGARLPLEEAVIGMVQDLIGALETVPDALLDFFMPICAAPERPEKMERWAKAAMAKGSDDQIDQCVVKLLLDVEAQNDAIFGLALFVQLFPERREAIVGGLPMPLERFTGWGGRFQAAVSVLSGGTA